MGMALPRSSPHGSSVTQAGFLKNTMVSSAAVRPLNLCALGVAVRELGSERRETVRSLSTVGVGKLRDSALSTRGPGWMSPPSSRSSGLRRVNLRFIMGNPCNAGLARRSETKAGSHAQWDKC